MGSHAKKSVYVDYAASTPVDERVRAAMQPYWSEHPANPSSLHSEARTARAAVEESRTIVAEALSCMPEEITFTSGGTEANALCILGAVDQCHAEGMHLITSVIEHPSVLDCFKAFERRGAAVSYIGVDQHGILDMEEFEQALRPDTALVSIMFANNEIGTIQPIAEVSALMEKACPDALLHTDAIQVPLYYEIDIKKLGVDLLSIDGQKMHGPKGVGAIYQRDGVELAPLFYGGKQESGLRPGTENVSGIVGFAKSFEIAERQREEDVARISELRDFFIDRLENLFQDCIINGDRKRRLPNNVNVSFPSIEGEFLVLQLDAAGIYCSTRSACFGAGGEGSPVIAALDEVHANNAVRFSLGRETTREDIEYILKVLQKKISNEH